MISLTLSRGTPERLPFPRFQIKRDMWVATRQYVHTRAMKTLRVLSVLAFGAGIVFSMVGFSIPSAKPAIRQAQASNNVVVSKPPVKKAASTPGPCQDAQTNDRSFASCPSFLEDYSGQSQGTINTNDFTVYTGAPEANNEAEYYTSSTQNLRIQNGSLVLEALNSPENGYNYTSARISTQNKENFLYGKIVVKASMPTGIGTWPAIWMLASNPKYASLSPASDTNRYLNDGEIDIAESVGTDQNTIYGIAHSVAYPEDGTNRSYFNTITVPHSGATFHEYEVDWTPTSLTYRVDGQAYFTYTKQPNADYRSWPFDQQFYLIINLALGGTWGGTDTSQFPGDGVDKNALPTSLNVQSISYYPYIGAM